jgi:short-subunit dehydrogenase
MKPTKHFLIYGASRGLGAALAAGLPGPGDHVWPVSRSQPKPAADGVVQTWIPADLSERGAGAAVAAALNGARIDVAIYNAGIWERAAFSRAYDVSRTDDDENERVLQVNLVSAVTSLNKLLPNLRQSSNAKVVLVGSINGLENTRFSEVAYSASKFGLRGVAHALREGWRKYKIGVTVLNPGSFPNDIPYEDLIALVRCVINLSNRTCVKEIDVPAMDDPNV